MELIDKEVAALHERAAGMFWGGSQAGTATPSPQLSPSRNRSPARKQYYQRQEIEEWGVNSPPGWWLEDPKTQAKKSRVRKLNLEAVSGKSASPKKMSSRHNAPASRRSGTPTAGQVSLREAIDELAKDHDGPPESLRRGLRRPGRITGSPTGRYAGTAWRREHVREADPMAMIETYSRPMSPSKLIPSQDNSRPIVNQAGTAVPQGCGVQGVRPSLGAGFSRQLVEAPPGYVTAKQGWVSAQAWTESLRHYPDKVEAQRNGESKIALSGLTHSISKLPEEHIEMPLRTRLNLGPADPDWRPDQEWHTWAPDLGGMARLKKRVEKTVMGMLSNRSTTKATTDLDVTPRYLEATKSHMRSVNASRGDRDRFSESKLETIKELRSKKEKRGKKVKDSKDEMGDGSEVQV